MHFLFPSLSLFSIYNFWSCSWFVVCFSYTCAVKGSFQ